MTWHVYALKDPRDDSVRYVGTTRNAKERFRGHLGERSTGRKAAWIAELRTLELAPEVCILESGDGGRNEQALCERRLIEHYRGVHLLNLTRTQQDGSRAPSDTAER